MDTNAINQLIKRHVCPVCGFTEIEVFDEHQCTTHEICKCCGNQSGYDYDLQSTQEQILRLRKDWVLTTGDRWLGSFFDIPNDWSAFVQMKQAGHSYPLIPTLMAFFHLGLIDDKYAQAWADRNIESELDDFDALLLISMHGMPRGIKFHDYEFPSRRQFSFSEEFALRVQRLDVKNIDDSKQFIEWVSRASLSLDLDKPEAVFGYQMDHYCDYNEGVDPYDYLVSEIEGFKKSTAILSKELWEEIK